MRALIAWTAVVLLHLLLAPWSWHGAPAVISGLLTGATAAVWFIVGVEASV